jgi:hypothetical protein
MTNEEWKDLTARAARAAGIELLWSSEPDLKPRRKDTMQTFAPLDDDGDAFRLMVQLQMTVEADEHPRATTHWAESVWAPFPLVEDTAATIRRCIVGAAASLPGAEQ